MCAENLIFDSFILYELKYHKLIAEFVCSVLCVWISSDKNMYWRDKFSCIKYLKENDFEIEIDWLFFEVLFLLGIIRYLIKCFIKNTN